MQSGMSSTLDLPYLGVVKPTDALTITISVLVLYVVGAFSAALVNAFTGPLSKYPGPKLRALSVVPKVWSIYSGNEAAHYVKLHQKYGSIVRVAPNELSYVGNEQVWKDIHGFKKMGKDQPHKDPMMTGKPLNGIDNLLTADDANHTRQRKILSHAFADRTLKDLEPMLKSWVAKLVQKLGEAADVGKKSDMLKMYNCTTFDIMADLCFNESLHMLENTTYHPWVETIFKGVKSITPYRALQYLGEPVRYFFDEILFKSEYARQASHQHWKYCADRVDKRMKTIPERTDLWSKILEKSTGPDKLSLDEHYATAVVFMGAGTETSASAITGITYHLLNNRSMLDKLTTEIRSNFSTLEDLTLDDLRRLPYLDAVIHEGLRMYPPVPIALARKAPAGGTLIADQYVPANTTIGIHHLATYRHPSNFRDAYTFAPERWLGTDSNYKNDRLGSFEPFSVGPRNCLGKNLAWHEIRLILAGTLLCFDLRLEEESRGWDRQKVFLLWEKKELWCRLTPVRSGQAKSDV